MLGSIHNNESLRLKSEFKDIYEIYNSGQDALKKYEVFNDLDLLYLSHSDIGEYPKIVILYQYFLKLIKQYPKIENEIASKIASIETVFVKKALSKQIRDIYFNIKNFDSISNKLFYFALFLEIIFALIIAYDTS